MNITAAINQANRNSRALNMKAEGYSLVIYRDWLTVEVHKPGNTTMMQDYMVNRAEGTCTCADYANRKQTCKHQMFVELILADYPQAVKALEEAQDEAQMWQAQAAQWEAQQKAAECAAGVDYRL